jgi:putative ABC transport system permease protein
LFMFKNLKTALRLAMKNLGRNPARSFLSILGIIIGVAAVFAVLSLGLGFYDFVRGQLEAFGTDLIEIEYKVPGTDQMSSENAGGVMGGGQAITLELEDAEAVGELENISGWYAGSLGQEVAQFRGEDRRVYLFGATEGIRTVDSNFKLAEGRMFDDQEGRSLKQVAVLGSAAKEDLFGSAEAVDRDVKLGGERYRVIGVLQERGMGGMLDFDEMIFVPLETLQKRVMGVDHIAFAMFKLKDSDKTDLTVAQAEAVMRQQHNIDDPEDDDFAVLALSEAMEMMDTVFSIVNILLVGLTSISLIVGGVGIMNVMYVAVVERTFEIGLRKALGARRGDILRQFLLEAVIITLLGGLLGVLLGMGVAWAAERVIVGLGFNLQIPFSVGGVVLGVGFSALVGIGFGVYPARKAAAISPMEALGKR